MAKVISVGYAVPPYNYSQEEVFASLKYPRAFWRLFRDSGIERRYFCLPLDRIRRLSFQEQQEQYLQHALALSKEAALKCLDGRDPREIGCLVYSSCTGFTPGPTLPHYLARELGLSPSTYFNNISAMGCESGFPGLKRADDFAKVSGKQALVIACELSELTYYPEPDGKPDPANDYELLRANAVFGSGASAALVGFDHEWRHPTIVDTETHTSTDFLDDLGYVWRDGRLHVRLSRRVPELAPLVVKPAVERLLARLGLSPERITWWIIHAAGSAVLNNIRDAIGLTEEKVTLSRDTLRLFGNTSSSSIGITSKRLMEQNIQPGQYAAMLSIGPGMTGGASLFQFYG